MTPAPGTPPAFPNTACPRSRGWLAVLALAALLGGLLALSPLAPVTAEPSGYCSDGYANPEAQVNGDDYGIPLWFGVESGLDLGRPGYVGICYGTNAPGQPKTLGGFFAAEVSTTPDGLDAQGGNGNDSNSAVQAPAQTQVGPSYSLAPGGTSGGQVLSFEIPASVCSGPCYPAGDSGLETTGVIVGTIQQTPTGTGGTSAAYRLTSLCVKADGQTVAGSCTSEVDDAGVTTTGTDPVTSQTATPGPCALGSVCAPSYNYLGTTGSQIATVYVPVLGPIPVYGVHTCAYTKDAGTSCPA